jgi:ABC-type multidrug transport system fused ATPase/permease subunit
LIIGMEGGRVVEVGKPDELLARGSSGSLFASLYSHM